MRGWLGFALTRQLVRAFKYAQNGNIGMIFTISLIPVIGAIGTALDLGKMNDINVKLQRALDAAVLAGVTQPTAAQVSAANQIFTGDYFDKFGTTASASFTPNGDGSLSGTASSSVATPFLAVFGFSAVSVHASATAKPGAQPQPVCILLVNQLASQALLVNAGAVLNAPTCEIDVQSTRGPAAIFNTTLNVKNICIAGTTIIKNGGSDPPAQTGCAAISDPFVGKLPTVSVGNCDFNGQAFDPGNLTLNPGVYCGSTNFNGSGTLTLRPGLYIISGGAMTFNSGWTVNGAGVTFYLVDQNSTLQFNGSVDATLSAPTSGTYANILMFEPNGLGTEQLAIDGSSGSSFTGLIYLPSREVTINSVSNMTTNKVTMVFSSLILDQINWAIDQGALAMSRSLNNAPYLSH